MYIFIKNKIVMAVVYRHRRLDNNEIFYVGIGMKKKRAFEKRSRNDMWKNITNKTKYEVEIIMEDIEYDLAKELEILLIEVYGRRDLSLGTLVNMTNGGDGNNGMSKGQRKKISEKLTGHKQSEETRKKKSESLKKTWSNPELRELKSKQTTELNKLGIIGTKGKVSKKKGISLTEEHKKKTSIGLKKFYKNNKPHNFKVIDEETIKNIIYDYSDGINKFQLHKKYKLNRKIIDRLIQEYYENK
jgi:hypothetical protein